MAASVCFLGEILFRPFHFRAPKSGLSTLVVVVCLWLVTFGNPQTFTQPPFAVVAFVLKAYFFWLRSLYFMPSFPFPSYHASRVSNSLTCAKYPYVRGKTSNKVNQPPFRAHSKDNLNGG